MFGQLPGEKLYRKRFVDSIPASFFDLLFRADAALILSDKNRQARRGVIQRNKRCTGDQLASLKTRGRREGPQPAYWFSEMLAWNYDFQSRVIRS